MYPKRPGNVHAPLPKKGYLPRLVSNPLAFLRGRYPFWGEGYEHRYEPRAKRVTPTSTRLASGSPAGQPSALGRSLGSRRRPRSCTSTERPGCRRPPKNLGVKIGGHERRGRWPTKSHSEIWVCLNPERLCWGIYFS